MLFRLGMSIVFIHLRILSLATEIHIQQGCIDITVGSGRSARTDRTCACYPDNDFWHPLRCKYKNYSTGWLSTKVTILDTPCEETFWFPTRYAKVFYTVDGCLRDGRHKPIHCCPRHPYQFPYVQPAVSDEPSSDDGTPSTQMASLDTTSLWDEVPFNNKLTLNNDMLSNDVTTNDENIDPFGDATADFGGLGFSVTRRGIPVKPYTTVPKEKLRLLEDEVGIR